MFYVSVEKNPRPASKISSLIQEAENKASKKKSSIENLNLMKRESPLGGEDNSSKSDDLSNAPKLPPKPGKKRKIMLKKSMVFWLDLLQVLNFELGMRFK